MKDELDQIGKNVRRLREERAFSREALAFHSGLSWSAIEQIESGRRRDVHISTISAIARALGCRVDTLLSSEGARSALTHEALLYDSEQAFIRGIEPHIRKGIAEGAGTLVITTPKKISVLKKTLGSNADQVQLIVSSNWYRAPADALNQLENYVNENSHRGVRTVGELVLAGLPQSERDAWARYDSFVNRIFADVNAHFVCVYDVRSLPKNVIEKAKQTHPRLLGESGSTSSEEYVDPEQFILS